MRRRRDWCTRMAVCSTSKIRCLLSTEVKMIGMSLNGASFFFRNSVHSFIVLLSFSIRSHLFTTMTHPLRLRTIRLKMFRSCDSSPCCASSIRMQTSEFSMARIDRITE